MADRDWRPIETAPRDGTEVDVWNGNRIPNAKWTRPDGGSDEFKAWCHFDVDQCPYGNGVDRCWDMIYPEPTHWMPLPPPPGGSDG